MSSELEALSWGVLTQAWAWRWASIFLLGSGPTVLERLTKASGQSWGVPPLARQAGALCAVLLCLWSWPLVVDTYRVESQDSHALERLDCTVTEHGDQAVCSGETLAVPGGAMATGSAVVWRLRESKLVVAGQN